MSKLDSSFYQRIKFKYKLSILNENTLEEVWRVRLSKLSVFLASFSIAILYFFIIAFLIIKTPLRSFLPGYTDNVNLRSHVLLDAVRADSLEDVMKVQHQYIAALSDIMKGNVKTDSALTNDAPPVPEKEKINPDKSANESKFQADYEESEKYNTSVIDNPQPTDVNYLMHNPVKGIVEQRFNDKNGSFGVSVTANPQSNVYSILDGTVLYSGYSAEDSRYLIQIQHPDDIISIYKADRPFLKKKGDRVQTGEILLTFLQDTAPSLYFELWKKGKVLNPQNYLTF